MSTLVPSFRPITGKIRWKMEDYDFDYHQAVFRSRFADMLYDTERNQMYYLALKKAVKKIKDRGEKVKVLDIGTGTGILSMMAARCGADSVVACEVFTPMAKYTKEIIALNKYSDVITVIPKRSTKLKVGPGADMDARANILVTDMFYTEFIGETIQTFTHAHSQLLEKACIVIPTLANIYVQVVESEHFTSWNQLKPVSIDSELVIPPKSIAECSGAAAVHDLQLTEFPQTDFNALSDPVHVFRFDFSGKTTLSFSDRSLRKVIAKQSGKCQVVFMWWDFDMDEEREIVLSCAPIWAHKSPDNMQWRDHWMQAVYYPRTSIDVVKGEEFKLHSFYDKFSLWFSFDSNNTDLKNNNLSPACTCRFHYLNSLHYLNSRTRIGMLNDEERNKKYIKVLKEVITPQTTCLCLGDGSLLPFMVAKLGAQQVYCIENLFFDISEEFVDTNNLKDKVKVISGNINIDDIVTGSIDVVIGEPFYSSSLLPWDNILFWHSWTSLPESLFSNNVQILPGNLAVWGVCVHFEHLWKIRHPVRDIEGFDVSPFAKLVEDSINISDNIVEPQPLIEYPCIALSTPFKALTLDFKSKIIDKIISDDGDVNIDRNHKPVNGIALWADFKHGENTWISTGPRENIVVGNRITWDRYTRQGVYFIPHDKYKYEISKCVYRAELNNDSGDLNFSFDFQ